MAARRTQFRRRKEPIQRQIDSAVPVRLIFQFPEYFPERRIRNVFGQIAPTCISADGEADECRVVGKLSAPDDVERLRLLGESDQAIFKCEGVGGVAGRLATAPGFESWILRPLLEEIRKGHIEVTQRLLEHNGTDFGKKGPLGFLFPFGEFCCGGIIADGFLLLLPGGSSIFQRLIVNIASATEGLRKLRGLLVSREESVFEGRLYYHEDILLGEDAYCNTVNCGRSAHDARIHLHPSWLYGWSILSLV